ncbi:MAG: hypothetical protein JWN52_5286 [Actinomycetia bacterium]|nr:hypothetical protein [Actinomycetes bacterium]
MSPLDSLPDGLPPGRLIVPDLDFADDMWADRPVMWVSDGPVPDAGEQWKRLFDGHLKTGLYPLLLETLYGDAGRPWHVGELSPMSAGAVDALTAEGVLRRFWAEVTDDDDGVDLPYPSWPGPAARGGSLADPDTVAREHVASLGAESVLLGLVTSARGADTLTACGWNGPCNHTDHTQEISAVLRSWEDRFGVRVVRVGFDTLSLSVAAPPSTIEHARHVAAEHHAFCPDNIWQGGVTFEEYAVGLIDSAHWSFWWD